MILTILLNAYSTFKYIEVTDYCVMYACHQDSLTWQIRADACLCYDTKALAIVDSEIPKQLKRYLNILLAEAIMYLDFVH